MGCKGQDFTKGDFDHTIALLKYKYVNVSFCQNFQGFPRFSTSNFFGVKFSILQRGGRGIKSKSA